MTISSSLLCNHILYDVFYLKEHVLESFVIVKIVHCSLISEHPCLIVLIFKVVEVTSALEKLKISHLLSLALEDVSCKRDLRVFILINNHIAPLIDLNMISVMMLVRVVLLQGDMHGVSVVKMRN